MYVGSDMLISRYNAPTPQVIQGHRIKVKVTRTGMLISSENACMFVCLL